MERMVQHIAQQFVNKLPAGRDFYTPNELYKSGVPDFIVERVILAINFNLSESIVPPHSEWADMASESVQEAWLQFLDAIAGEHRMPASAASSVFVTAVMDTLELLCQPRVAVAEAIFGKDESLPIEILRDRIVNVTVYKHLPTAVLRYMDRKQKKKITFEECRQIIEKVDERLVQNYNPLSWAQLLEPVFLLAGPSVDTNLFRVFFEDKERNRLARKFELLNSSLNKKEFIEALSEPEVTDPEEFDSAKKSDSLHRLFKREPEESLSEETEFQQGEEDEDSILNSFQRRLTQEDEDDEINDSDHLNESGEEQHEEGSLHRRFIFDADAMEEQEIPDDGPHSNLYKEMNLKQDRSFSEDEVFEPKKEETKQEFKKKKKPSSEDESEENEVRKNISFLLNRVRQPEEREIEKKYNEDDADDTDTDEPIWKSFLDEGSADWDDKLDDGGFSDSGFDLEASAPDDKIKALSGWMKTDEERFVSAIFGDSGFAYEKALENIYDFEDWKQASRYVEKEVFARNRVDVFDEVAVDFTDRLHTFFMEFKSPKMNG